MKQPIPLIAASLALLATSAAASTAGGAPGPAPALIPSPSTGLLVNGRHIDPQGTQVALGNFPTGGAVTADGRYLWTVSAGFGANDVRIVNTASHRVCQILPVPGASGAVALDSRNRLAYVSGEPNSRWEQSRNTLPGAGGNSVLVFSWTSRCGGARLVRVIAVPPPKGAPIVQTFPPIPARSNEAVGSTSSWPQKLAVSPDGTQLLVPLNLADSAAVVNLAGAGHGDQVRYVPMGSGSYPYAAAILPGGKTGLVSNEATGTVSVVNLRTAAVLATITVGPPLSHPEGIVIDPAGARAYVALTAADEVVVIDLHNRRVQRTLSVGRSAGLGTMPVDLALGPHNARLFVAESGGDEISVISVPQPNQRGSSTDWRTIGRIPTAEDPMALATAAGAGGRAQLVYVSARGAGVGPNVLGPNPMLASDPIFWAFNPIAPSTDIFANGEVTYLPGMTDGRAGLMALPSDGLVERLTPAALRQIQPVNAELAPAGTPLRAGGPIKHVFFVVRENRSYDQMLGDLPRGNGDPQLAVFGPNITPNMRSLVTRFPLLDNVYADSEASIQGHFWTAAASVPDYVERNWVQQYAGRGRPNDFGVYAVTYPGNGFLFNQAQRQHFSYFNYGEGIAADEPGVPDRDRSPALLASETSVAANSDLGPTLTPGGCYPLDLTIGTSLDNREIFDSTLPAGAPAGSYSHTGCFLARFEKQLATGTVPALNYLSLTSDHTRGTQPGFPVPSAMVADSDQAVGQLVSAISHSSIWSSSAIFVVEDDSQDGADHVNAHRIPIMVISPYARPGAIIHARYDLVSVVRSIELILSMKALSLNDALATPMYAAFAPKVVNPAPVNAIPARVNLLQRNGPDAPWAALSSRLDLAHADEVPQVELDGILWRSVHGASSTPPPAGPGADAE